MEDECYTVSVPLVAGMKSVVCLVPWLVEVVSYGETEGTEVTEGIKVLL